MSFPPGSFFHIEDEVYVVAPELSFIQMARCLPLEQLVHYGMMLCGVYYRTPVSISEGFDGQHIKRKTGQRDALVTLEDLAFYVRRRSRPPHRWCLSAGAPGLWLRDQS